MGGVGTGYYVLRALRLRSRRSARRSSGAEPRTDALSLEPHACSARVRAMSVQGIQGPGSISESISRRVSWESGGWLCGVPGYFVQNTLDTLVSSALARSGDGQSQLLTSRCRSAVGSRMSAFCKVADAAPADFEGQLTTRSGPNTTAQIHCEIPQTGNTGP